MFKTMIKIMLAIALLGGIFLIYKKNALAGEITFLAVVFYGCIQYTRKHYDISKLKWKKLFLEFYIISFLFFISILILGSAFGIEILKNVLWFFGALFLLIIPVIVYFVYYLYGSRFASKKFFGTKYLLVFNRLCEILLAIHIISSF